MGGSSLWIKFVIQLISRNPYGRKEAANVVGYDFFCVSLCHKLGAKIGVIFPHPQPPERRDRTKNGGKY